MREARMLGAEHLKEKLESRLYKQNFGCAFFFDKIPFFFSIRFYASNFTYFMCKVKRLSELLQFGAPMLRLLLFPAAVKLFENPNDVGDSPVLLSPADRV